MRPILKDILIEGVEAAGPPVVFGVTVQSIEREADRVAVKLTDGSHGAFRRNLANRQRGARPATSLRAAL